MQEKNVSFQRNKLFCSCIPIRRAIRFKNPFFIQFHVNWIYSFFILKYTLILKPLHALFSRHIHEHEKYIYFSSSSNFKHAHSCLTDKRRTRMTFTEIVVCRRASQKLNIINIRRNCMSS